MSEKLFKKKNQDSDVKSLTFCWFFNILHYIYLCTMPPCMLFVGPLCARYFKKSWKRPCAEYRVIKKCHKTSTWRSYNLHWHGYHSAVCSY